VTDGTEELELARRRLALIRMNDAAGVICADDCISPQGTTVTYRGVTRQNPALICTEPNNHAGPHIARAEEDVVILSWARGKGRAG
jgi:BarA-like signal transduction histidine kinase